MKKKNIVNCTAYLFYEQNEDGSRKVDGIIGLQPVYQTKKAACADLAMPYPATIPPQSVMKFDLWIGFEIPEGYKIIMYPRSSLLTKKKLVQPVSIIDKDYSGQHIHVPLVNFTNEPIELDKGERIAQIECVPAYDCVDWTRIECDRIGGFGSTGAK